MAASLQTALDRTVNRDFSTDFGILSGHVGHIREDNTADGTVRDIANGVLSLPGGGETQASAAVGTPGWVLQADILQALGPILAARSDTFVIRTRGESRNPATNKVTATVLYEITVQRIPEFVDTERRMPVRPAWITGSNLKRLRRFATITESAP